MSNRLLGNIGQAQLFQASVHLYYEYSMLLELGNRIPSIDPEDTLIRNALLEAFILHFRILWDFLYGKKMKPTDVIADDYVLSPEGLTELKNSIPENLMDYKDRTGPVFHLSYKRLDYSDVQKQWPVLLIACQMKSAMNEFIKIVPPERLSQEWKKIPQGPDAPPATMNT